MYAVAIGGANNVAMSEERGIAIVERYGGEVEGCVCEEAEEEEKQRKRE